MINSISHTYVWVEDQDRALSFYTEKLGFEARDDIRIGDRRWVTVGHPTHPELRLVLSPIGPPLHPETVEHIREMLARGDIIGGGFSTDDCRKTYEELAAKGVTFVKQPEERPYGVEAVLQDDSGNLWGLVQPRG
jgi:catechol 2,3-dioxygenase-like lactoylglutathione lyase family enzyme